MEELVAFYESYSEIELLDETCNKSISDFLKAVDTSKYTLYKMNVINVFGCTPRIEVQLLLDPATESEQICSGSFDLGMNFEAI